MKSDKHPPATAHHGPAAPKKSLEDQVKDLGEKCGIAGPLRGEASAEAFGDGQFLKNFLAFLQGLIPILIPIFKPGEAEAQG